MNKLFAIAAVLLLALPAILLAAPSARYSDAGASAQYAAANAQVADEQVAPLPPVKKSHADAASQTAKAAIADESDRVPLPPANARDAELLNDNSQPSITTSFSGMGNVYSITATASDPSGISEINIYIRSPSRNIFSLVKTCHSSTTCVYTSGGNNGAYTYYATAFDASFQRNSASSSRLTFFLPVKNNQPPVITSVNGPSSLGVGETGTWSITAYDPENGQLYYSVEWGDRDARLAKNTNDNQTATFTHVYFSNGSYIIKFTVTDDQGASAYASTQVIVGASPVPVIVTSTLPSGIVGADYSTDVIAAGGTPPYSWALESGALPPGISLSSGAVKAHLSGVPSAPGNFTFTLQVTDDNGASASKQLGIMVYAASSAISCSLSPANISVAQNTTLQVTASCFEGLAPNATSGIPCPPLRWSSTIGSISSTGPSWNIAVFNSGALAGIGTITASGGRPGGSKDSSFSCSAPVAVKAAAQAQTGNGNSGGSTGGSGSGSSGGSYRTSTKVSVTCAGQEAQMSVNYLVPSAPQALVEVFYLGEKSNTKVFSQKVSATSTLTFVPAEDGAYEVRVSIDGTQATSNFAVSACTPKTMNFTRNITVNLAPQRETVLSKSVTYGNGFSKDFKVYKISSGTIDSYSTDITLTYVNSGGKLLENVGIFDSIPKEVLSSADKVEFQNQPATLESKPGPHFTWNVRSLAVGDSVSYTYTIKRPLTEQMFAAFAPPRLLAAGEAVKEPVGESGTSQAGSDLLAANVGFIGFALPLSTLAIAAVGLVLFGLIALFIFGRKKEE